jgi:4-alpha-glucanotransferase
MNRSSGLFLHPTSFPSKFGIGDLGSEAFKWIDLLVDMHQSFWQLCPLGPTGYGDSPYQSFCSFAGNTLLISPEKLLQKKLLKSEDLISFPTLSESEVDFGAVIQHKELLYQKAYSRFIDDHDFLTFCEKQHYWLHDYALFKVLKDHNQGKPWYEWQPNHKLRFPAVLDDLYNSERQQVRYQKFLQYIFHSQWLELKNYANSKGIKIIGDIPYYTAYDSVEAWASSELFEMDETGKPYRVAGVPPDYFSETGQLWGNPLFQWENMRQDGFSWWIKRIKKILEWVDVIRLDHFRGFDSFWAIPAESKTAMNGKWEKGPGFQFFDSIKRALGNLPLIAEDLGELTEGVDELRNNVGIPGMKILQFAFDGNPSNPYLPYNINSDSITYTGTHDNDTSIGWLQSLVETDRLRVLRFLDCNEEQFCSHFLRLAFSSPSKLCIVPFQDVLQLGSDHRMNVPGKVSGNWKWRYTNEMMTKNKLNFVADLTQIYGRAPGEYF